MPIVDPLVDAFLTANAPARDPVLREMEARGARDGFPLVGPAVGALLEVLARAVGARRVLELGSGFGYSAAWWLRGMPSDGEVVLTEDDPALAKDGAAYLDRLGHRGRHAYVLGDAVESLGRATGTFDVVFCDLDKASYPRIVEPALARLRPGGLLVADNALWSGRVADPSAADADTAAIREYLRLVRERPGLATTVLPLRDGVAVSLVLAPPGGAGPKSA
jgi:caffeoyl-CoA O-methyltransferase